MNRFNLAFIAIVSMVVLLASCSDGRKTYRIGVSQCSARPWRDKLNNEMLAAQHLYEADAKVSIVCAYDNSKRQVAYPVRLRDGARTLTATVVLDVFIIH